MGDKVLAGKRQLLGAGMVAGVRGIRCWLAKHMIAKSGDGCRCWGIRGWLRNANCLQSSLSIVAGMGVDL